MKGQPETEHTVIDSLCELTTLSKIQRLRLITHSPLKGARKMKIERLNDRHLFKVLRFMQAGWDNKRIVQVIRDTWEYKELFADELFNELGRLKRGWRQQEKQIAEAQAIQAAQIIDPQKKQKEAGHVDSDEDKDRRRPGGKKRPKQAKNSEPAEIAGAEIGGEEEKFLGVLPPALPESMNLDNPSRHDPRVGILHLLGIELNRIDQYRRFECREGPMLKELSDAIERARALEREYFDMSSKMGQLKRDNSDNSSTDEALERFGELTSANVSDKDLAAAVISKFTEKLASMAVPPKIPQEQAVDNTGTEMVAV